eukprot:gene7667-824_t
MFQPSVVYMQGYEGMLTVVHMLSVAHDCGPLVSGPHADSVSVSVRAFCGPHAVSGYEGMLTRRRLNRPELPAHIEVTPVRPQCDPRVTPVRPQCDPRVTPVRPQCDPRVTPVRPQYDPRVTPVRPQCDPRVTPVRPQCDPRVTPVHKWMELVFMPGCMEEVREAAPRYHVKKATKAAASKQASHQHAEPPKPIRVAQQEAIRVQATNQHNHMLNVRDAAPKYHVKNVTKAASTKKAYRASLHVAQEEALHVCSSGAYLKNGHLCNNSNISLYHLSVPAAGPGYTERCVLQHVPPDADLVIMEYACNDYLYPEKLMSHERLAFERLIRFSLTLPSNPAILIFHAYCYKMAHSSFADNLTLAEEKHTMLAQYYGNVQVLSARSALYDIVSSSNVVDSDVAARVIYQRDLLHLMERGHRWHDQADYNLGESSGSALKAQQENHMLGEGSDSDLKTGQAEHAEQGNHTLDESSKSALKIEQANHTSGESSKSVLKVEQANHTLGGSSDSVLKVEQANHTSGESSKSVLK